MSLMLLTYRSVATTPPDPMSWSTLTEQSHRFNHRHGITGALLFDGRRFLQTIEGPLHILERLQRKLLADPRHTDFEVLGLRALPRRLFGSWSMKMMRLDAGDARAPEGLDLGAPMLRDPCALLAAVIAIRVSGGPTAA